MGDTSGYDGMFWRSIGERDREGEGVNACIRRSTDSMTARAKSSITVVMGGSPLVHVLARPGSPKITLFM